MYNKIVILVGSTLTLVGCDRAVMEPEYALGSEYVAVLDQGAASSASLMAAPATSAGLVRTTWPSGEDAGPPFYARVEPVPPHVLIVDGWAVIPFYRDPSCVPKDFNLLSFFDPPAVFACPLVVEGFSLRTDEPLVGAPKIANSWGMGSVPFWFIPAGAMFDALQDGTLTIGELASIPGRLTGYATRFNEVHHPSAAPLPPPLGGGGHPVPKLIQNAQGTLEGDRSFHFELTRVNGELKTIRLRFR